MTALDRMLDLLPPPYGVAEDGILAQLLETVALEIDAIGEDIERLRRTHWIEQCYRLGDAAKLGSLLRIAPLSWETLETFRARLLPLIAARLAGGLGPGELRGFVHDYLRRAQAELGATLVPGLPPKVGDAFSVLESRPRWRSLGIDENPRRIRTSKALAARSGLVPAPQRWREPNRGLDETVVANLRITGLTGGRTAAPMLVNLTSGNAILYSGRLSAGTELTIEADPAGGTRAARASIDGVDVTNKLHSFADFTPGMALTEDTFDPAPLLPRMPRGDNDWLFLAIGRFDQRGLDHFLFAVPDPQVSQGSFDETYFDLALFDAKPHAHLELSWNEVEPASFEVSIPRTIVIEPTGAADADRAWRRVGEAIEIGVGGLRAAGVRAAVRFEPFTETQAQLVRHALPWVRLDRETAPVGASDVVELGLLFDETGLGHARFE